MRLFREPMTIVAGQTVSNGINLGQEKLRGFHVQQQMGGGGGTDLRVQALVSGNLGDAASEVWADISLTQTDNPPTGGYLTFLFKFAIAEITTGKLILLPSNAAYPPPVIRLAAQAAVSGASLIVRAISDPHS